MKTSAAHKRQGTTTKPGPALAAVFLSLILRASSFAAEIIPVYDIRFFSGQHFHDGSASSLSGNFTVQASPAVRFNDRWSLVPTYTGGYQGTRDVQELAGGGTLFQDSTSHGLLVKPVYHAGGWKFKASAGARYEFLRETEDEDWGDGLFDHRKYSGGVEIEYGEAAGGRAGYDYYTLDFPNYQSLESAQDPTLSRELTGKDVLNSRNHLASAGFWAPLPGGLRADAAFYFNGRRFDDQPVVAASGSPTAQDRADQVLAASLAFSRPWTWGESVRCAAELGVSYNATDSNQNHYDARKTVFLKDYYDYSQAAVSPRLSAALGGRPWLVSLSGSHSRRDYAERPVQDADGNYLSEKIRAAETTVGLGLAYPIGKNFKARAAGTLGWSDSNMEYEKVFSYNYKIANYLIGFSYEY
jgi:hypothetical protein